MTKSKSKSKASHSLGCTNDQQIQASLAIRTFITKDLDAARHQARPHSCDAADPDRSYDRRSHDGQLDGNSIRCAVFLLAWFARNSV